ncbi:MAG: hypothetical protein AAGA03_06110 [Planctomycetota bacterium]
MLSHRLTHSWKIVKANRSTDKLVHGTILSLVAIGFATLATPGAACPFCSAVSQTIRQEMEVMDAVAVASCLDTDLSRDTRTGEVRMKIDRVLKGKQLIRAGEEVTVIYYGEIKSGRKFMLSGVDPPKLEWSALPLSKRAEAYVVKVGDLPKEDDVERLRFFMPYLEDEELMLSRDAYDEFAITPYVAIQKLAPEMDHAQLVEWLSDAEMSADRRRLYLTMLGVCGSKADLPMLESMLTSTEKSSRSGLDALIACYLTLAGESGLPMINKLFITNKSAPYAETYAAIMAIRFHGTDGDVIARSALLPSLHHILERQDLADLVIPDLARWNDWSQIDRLTRLFIEADENNTWVRVPVVNYLQACPLPAAKEAIEKVKKVDPESVSRANIFFPKPQAEPAS